jgi:hypothetical protein
MYQTSRAVGSFPPPDRIRGGRRLLAEAPFAHAPAPVDRGTDDNGAHRDSIARAEAARRDSLAREASLRDGREKRLAEARATRAAPVYFAYDRSDLSSVAREDSTPRRRS